MRDESRQFLREMLEAPSPSGYEQPAAAVYREYVSDFADDVQTDVMGSVVARLAGTGEGPSVMLSGHIDEIGFMVTYITDEGFIAFKPIGGVDVQLLPGIRVHVHAKDGVLLGVMGRMPIHLLDDDDKKKTPKMHKLFIDVGLGADDVKQKVRVGDPVTFAVGYEEFGDGLAVSRGFDDKMGAWVVAETMRLVGEQGGAPGDLFSAATVQEEVGLRGAVTSTYAIDPDVAVAVDVSHATDYPDVDKRRHGDFRLDEGPVVFRGPNVNPVVFERLVEAAAAADVPYQIEGMPRPGGTDAAVMQVTREGKPAGLVSVPLRYMHTPTEVLSLGDLDHAAELLAAFVMRLEPGCDFTP
jgi:endoglucanase